MKLEDIGFYTLSDERALTATKDTRLQRCELILTDRCNFKCPYCRGLREDLQGALNWEVAQQVVGLWLAHDLRCVRFSGGEPLLYPGLMDLVKQCKEGGVERIAISSNGSARLDRYLGLIEAGVNDFSISLDGACCSVGDTMSGGVKSWERVVSNIREIKDRTDCYVTVGAVFTEANRDEWQKLILFAEDLGVDDVRIIPAAQYKKAIEALEDLPQRILDKFPILNYRVQNVRAGRNVRGLECGAAKCRLAFDDMAVAQGWHFPCIIHMREGGDPIGRMEPGFRDQRAEWVERHDPYSDPICRANCLNVCKDYNETANLRN